MHIGVYLSFFRGLIGFHLPVKVFVYTFILDYLCIREVSSPYIYDTEKNLLFIYIVDLFC